MFLQGSFVFSTSHIYFMSYFLSIEAALNYFGMCPSTGLVKCSMIYEQHIMGMEEANASFLSLCSIVCDHPPLGTDLCRSSRLRTTHSVGRRCYERCQHSHTYSYAGEEDVTHHVGFSVLLKDHSVTPVGAVKYYAIYFFSPLFPNVFGQLEINVQHGCSLNFSKKILRHDMRVLN